MAQRNPILTGWNPDPSIVRVGSDYFLAVSSFEFVPGVPIYHSRDLESWTLISHAVPHVELRTPEPGAGIWAPTLRFHGGCFYVVTCKFDRYRPAQDERVFPRGFFVKSTNIWDPAAWSRPVYFDETGFDQDVFWDEDNKAYLCTTRRLAQRPANSVLKDFAVHICEVDMETGRSVGPTRVLRSSDTGIAEGSHIMKRDGWYYLFVAEGGTELGHSEKVYRSRHIGRDYEALQRPLLHNAPWHDVQSTGHADLFTDGNGGWWCVFLATRARPAASASVATRSPLGRETFIARVEWEDGWPVVNGGRHISLAGGSAGAVEWCEPFDNASLSNGWYYKCTPQKQFCHVRDNTVVIEGGPFPLASPEAPTAIFRKQTDFDFGFTVTLDFADFNSADQAGVCVYVNSYSYVSVGLCAGKIVAEKGAMVDGLQIECHERNDTCTRVRLRIAAERDLYTIYAESHAWPETCVARVKSDSLLHTPPEGMLFTGVMVGIYAASSAGSAVLEPAVFSQIHTCAGRRQ